MTGADVPVASTWKIVLLIAIFAVGACFTIWAAMSEWLSARAALAADRTTIDISASAAICVPLAIAFVCFLALPMLPKADPPKTKNGCLRTTKLQNAVFGVALACMPLTFFAIPIGRSVMNATMTKRDYRTCRNPDWPRGPTRWVRTDMACPPD